MSYTKRYLEDLYYDKIRDRNDEELIDEGVDPGLIECVRELFETEE